MITLSGTLYVKTINGSRGPFNVARLTTDIGNFAVRDTFIDELESGSYEGRFTIGYIYQAQRPMGDGLLVELRARVDDTDVISTNPEATDHIGVEETDPIDEIKKDPEPTNPASVKATDQYDPDNSQPTPEKGTEEPIGLEALFGAENCEFTNGAIQLLDTVTLDPSVPRARFREQTTALKERGYKFQPTEKVWKLPN